MVEDKKIFRRRLIVALCLVAVVAGAVLFMGRTPGARTLFLAEKTHSDGEDERSQLEHFELGLPAASDYFLSHPDFAHRIGEDTVDAQAALTAAHLQRGPPCC